MKIFILTWVLGLSSIFAPTSSQEAQTILGRMHKSLQDISAHSYRLQLKERKMDKSYHQGEMLIRVENKPLKIRAELLEPDKGPLVEYDAAADVEAATITPKKWLPAIKIKSEIHGSMLRRGHYAINETSLSYFDEIIKRSEVFFQKKGTYNTSVRYSGIVKYNQQSCHKIELLDPQYHIKNYSVKKNENLIDISKKLLIPPFKIRELNPHIDSYYEVGEGSSIKIPSSYSKRSVIYIDAEQFLPRRLEVYDENGTFEQYSFHDIHVKK